MKRKKNIQITEEGMKRLCSFFQILMEVDRREKITPTAKAMHEKKLNETKEDNGGEISQQTISNSAENL